MDQIPFLIATQSFITMQAFFTLLKVQSVRSAHSFQQLSVFRDLICRAKRAAAAPLDGASEPRQRFHNQTGDRLIMIWLQGMWYITRTNFRFCTCRV